MFDDVTVSDPADLYSSPHVLNEVEGNFTYCISYTPGKFQLNDSQ